MAVSWMSGLVKRTIIPFTGSRGLFLGSVHAIAETGEMVIASASGSQLPSYVFTSDNVIWVVGTQKIVPTLSDAMKRVREYTLPLEDARMKSEGFPGNTIGKLLIFENQKLGF